MTSLDDLMATFDRQREERLRMLLAINAYNATPAERRAVIGVLFALGREALDGGYDTEVPTIAHYIIERLNAHLFMARMVERGGDARGCDPAAEGRQQTNDELLR